jgi:hypothetical protein
VLESGVYVDVPYDTELKLNVKLSSEKSSLPTRGNTDSPKLLELDTLIELFVVILSENELIPDIVPLSKLIFLIFKVFDALS